MHRFLAVLFLGSCGHGASTTPAAAPRLPIPPPRPPIERVVGVENCDLYLAEMTRCIDRLDPRAKVPMMESLTTMRKAWLDVYDTPEGPAALKEVCRQARTVASQAFRVPGCVFSPVVEITDVIGIPACDLFLEQMRACRERMPVEQREGMTESIESIRDRWVHIARNPDYRPRIAASCKDTSLTARKAFAKHGCTFEQ